MTGYTSINQNSLIIEEDADVTYHTTLAPYNNVYVQSNINDMNIGNVNINHDKNLLIKGKIFIDDTDKSLQERLDRIEKILKIRPRNRALEEQYPDLKTLGDAMDEKLTELSHSFNGTMNTIIDAYSDFQKQCEIMEKMKSDND